MKYFFSILAVLALVGAGCVGASTINDDIAEDPSVDSTIEDLDDPSEDAGEEALEDEAAEEASEIADTDGDEVSEGEDDSDQGTTTTLNLNLDDSDVNEDGIIEIILGAPADVSLEMESGNFFFSPNTITAEPGASVSVTFTANAGFHTFVIDETGTKFTIAEGETFVFTAPEESGSYTFYCDVGSHRALGMEGTLIVE